MSYKPYEYEDSISESISRINDLKIILCKIEENKDNFDNFIIWYTKATQIDKNRTDKWLVDNFYIFTNKDIKDYISRIKKKTNYVNIRSFLN